MVQSVCFIQFLGVLIDRRCQCCSFFSPSYLSEFPILCANCKQIALFACINTFWYSDSFFFVFFALLTCFFFSTKVCCFLFLFSSVLRCFCVAIVLGFAIIFICSLRQMAFAVKLIGQRIYLFLNKTQQFPLNIYTHTFGCAGWLKWPD